MILKKIIKLALLTLTLTTLLNASILDKCKNKTIISQSPYITYSIDFFGMKDCIVGASVFDTQISDKIQKTGKIFFPDKEIIKKLQPDFIFTSDWTSRSTVLDITPLGAKSFILHGFQSMEQVENNLFTIGNVLKLANFTTKVQNFSKEWRELAHNIDSKEQKVLLMSACSKDPYSYGKKTYLGDLFSEAGFEVVDDSKQVKVFKITKDKNELDEFIKEKKPDFIFGFVSYTKSGTCSILTSKIKQAIIFLDGDKFMHPSPTLIDGLKELKSKQNEW